MFNFKVLFINTLYLAHFVFFVNKKTGKDYNPYQFYKL